MSHNLKIIDYNNLNKEKNFSNNIIIISKNASNNSNNNGSYMTIKNGQTKLQINLGKDKIVLNNNNIKNKILELKKNLTKLSKRRNRDKEIDIVKDNEERLNTIDRLKSEKEDILIFKQNKDILNEDKGSIFIINKARRENNDRILLHNYKIGRKKMHKNDKKIIKIKPKIKELIRSSENSKINSISLSQKNDKNNNNKKNIYNNDKIVKSENISDKVIHEGEDNKNIHNNGEKFINIENITENNFHKENNYFINNNIIINNMNINKINDEKEKNIKNVNNNENDNNDNNNLVEDEKSNRTKAEALDTVNILEDEVLNVNSNYYTIQNTIQSNQTKQLTNDSIQKNLISTIAINKSRNKNNIDTISSLRKNEIISSTQEGTISKHNDKISTFFKDTYKSIIPININIKKGNYFNKFPNVINSQNINLLNQLEMNKNKKIDFNKNKRVINIKDMHSIYENCILCGKRNPMVKLYSAKCQKHFLCKKCFKIFYEGEIKKGQKELLCPFIQCRAQMDFCAVKSIINNESLKIFFENNTINSEKRNYSYDNAKPLGDFSSPRNNDNLKLKLYSRKNIFDINTKNYKNIFNESKSSKGLFCPFCYGRSIFSQSSGHFMKCLNCGYSLCKYCGKEFNENHLEIYDKNHCKIYFRKLIIPIKQSKDSSQILLQLLYIFGIFFIVIVSPFFYLFNFMKNIIKPKRELSFINGIKFSLVYFISIILYLIIFPFIYLFIPYLPLIIVIFDFNN